MIVPQVVNSLGRVKTHVMEYLLPRGLPPSGINIPIGEEIFLCCCLTDFNPVLKRSTNVALPVFMRLPVNCIRAQSQVENDISFEFAAYEPNLLKAFEVHPVPRKDRYQLVSSRLLHKSFGQVRTCE